MDSLLPQKWHWSNHSTNPELGLCVYGYNCSKLNKQNVLVVGERNASNLSFTNDAIRLTPPNNRAAITPVFTDGPGTITKDPFRFSGLCNFRVVVWLYPLHLNARVAIDLVGLPVPV